MKRSGYLQNRIYLCIDEYEPDRVAGRIYKGMEPNEWVFDGADGLLLRMEELFDTAKYPAASVKSRTFGNSAAAQDTQKAKEPDIQEGGAMKDNSKETGNKATFMVQVQYRQNATWQGTVTWAEQDQKQQFRSALELIKLIDSALDESGMESEM